MRDHTHEDKKNPRFNRFAHIMCGVTKTVHHTPTDFQPRVETGTRETLQNLWRLENKQDFFYCNFRTKNIQGQ